MNLNCPCVAALDGYNRVVGPGKVPGHRPNGESLPSELKISGGPKVRIVTWNCSRGSFDSNHHHLMTLKPDLAAVQEIPKPHEPDRQRQLWVGDNPNMGLLLATSDRFRLEPIRAASRSPKLMLVARLLGPVQCNVAAIWAKPAAKRPCYVTTLLRALDVLDALRLRGPTIVFGDLNSHPLFGPAHYKVTARLWRDYGLVSAYHRFFNEEPEYESRHTLFHARNRTRGFHIDYCFIPRSWAGRISNVEVGQFRTWGRRSDHCPLVVDVGSKSRRRSKPVVSKIKRIPSAAAYRRALSSLRSQMTKSQVGMLRAHFLASDRTVTATYLAKAVGFRSYRATNISYGSFAARLGDELGVRLPIRVGVLATFIPPKLSESGEWELVMRGQLAEALGTLRWF